MTETSTPLIYAKMTEVMRAVQGVAKRDKNTHQNFNFRGIDAVMNAVGPVLREVGVIVVPRVQEVTYEKVSTTTGKPTTACRVEMGYTFYAEDGSSLATSVIGEAFDSGDKSAPKAMSVAFRTALLQALCLPTDEPDPDASTYERVETPKMTADQLALMTEKIRAAGMGGEEGKDHRAALFADLLKRPTNGGDLTQDEAGVIIDHLGNGELTAAQQEDLSQTLGAKPVGPREAAAEVGRNLKGQSAEDAKQSANETDQAEGNI